MPTKLRDNGLRKVLTSEQFDALPAAKDAGPQEDEILMDDSAVMIHRDG